MEDESVQVWFVERTDSGDKQNPTILTYATRTGVGSSEKSAR